LHKLGAIGPGRLADLVLFDDFNDLAIRRVYKNGRLVARDGAPVYDLASRPPATLRSSVNIKWLEGDEFIIPSRGQHCRVIGIVPDQIITDSLVMAPTVLDGQILSDIDRDLLRLYVVERHRASGRIGKGLVHGFHLQQGALATSIGHDSHNIIAIGISDNDVIKAVTTINKMGGGIALVNEGRVIESLELPIAGLMSDKPLEQVSSRTRSLVAACRNLGVTLADPIMTLSFMALPVIPQLKLTDQGLVDVQTFSHVDLFIE